MDGTLADNIAKYNLAGWRPEGRPAPAEGAIAYSGPSAGQPPSTLMARGETARPSQSQRDAHIQFIRDYANKIGVNPDLALGIAGAEGLNAWTGQNPAAQSYVKGPMGREESYGDFQLHMVPGAVGSAALAAGIDPRDPTQWQKADQFALDYMKAHGVSAWSGDPVAKAYAATGKVAPFVAGNTLNKTGGPAVGSQTGAPGPQGAATGTPTQPGAWGSGNPPQALAGFQAGSPAEKNMLAGAKTLGLSGDSGGGDETPRSVAPAITDARAIGGNMMMGAGGMNQMPSAVARQAFAQAGNMLSPLPANMLNTGGIQSPVPSTTQSAIQPGAPGAQSGLPLAGLGQGTTLNSPSQLQMAMLYGYPPYAGSYGTIGSPGGPSGYGSSF
jgi:hypothetical protein